MENKKIDMLSNAEIERYKIELKNEFDSTRNQIDKLCEHLKELDKEYIRCEKEQYNRKKTF